MWIKSLIFPCTSNHPFQITPHYTWITWITWYNMICYQVFVFFFSNFMIYLSRMRRVLCDILVATFWRGPFDNTSFNCSRQVFLIIVSSFSFFYSSIFLFAFSIVPKISVIRENFIDNKKEVTINQTRHKSYISSFFIFYLIIKSSLMLWNGNYITLAFRVEIS